MHKRAFDSAGLEELTRHRNRIAYELVNASEGERVTPHYLAKELEMNAYTERKRTTNSILHAMVDSG